jgi:hypothetical protein
MRIASFFATSVLFCSMAILPVHAQVVNQALKDRAVIVFDYNMYIEGNGGESTNSDGLHAEFMLKRKNYLNSLTQQTQPTQPIEATAPVQAPAPTIQKDDDLDKLIKLLNLVKGVKNIFQ